MFKNCWKVSDPGFKENYMKLRKKLFRRRWPRAPTKPANVMSDEIDVILKWLSREIQMPNITENAKPQAWRVIKKIQKHIYLN